MRMTNGREGEREGERERERERKAERGIKRQWGFEFFLQHDCSQQGHCLLLV